ncbi:putative tripartite motif-containing protein 2-like [Apostichopus japonicus]|uniref:Putative tripartite motif-containing protein 2-like n=1 Tax=Stichopus japonicus TaxID=307972 RepID=A0A2G8JV95_STIJA|nr:putative tripartite motif-containing protein 2-like [Apostichopus japonicus]
MASASVILKNIDENFCRCCICFEQYEDPRQLACLHRYCKHCIEQLIGRGNETINCPLCQAEFDVPENGAEGFKKDFYVNEILEFIQVQSSLEEDQSRQCVGCSQQEKPTAYCFKCRDFLCQKSKQEVISDAETKLQDTKSQYQQEVVKVDKERAKIREEGLRAKTAIKNKLEDNLMIRKREMEVKIEKLREDFEAMKVKDKLEADAKLEDLKIDQDAKESNLRKKNETIDKKWNDFRKLLKVEKKDKLTKGNEISDQIKRTIKRCDNITQTGSGVLSSDNNWTIAQNVGGIFSAAESFLRDMRREFPAMETLPESLSANLTFKEFEEVRNVTISRQVESVVDIDGIQAKGWSISGITCTKSGSIVVTGLTEGYTYHVTVVDQSGKAIRQCFIKSPQGTYRYPESYCAAFKEYQVVVAYDPHGIGVFDVRNGLFQEKEMSDIVDWPNGQDMRSVSVDDKGDYIIIGCGNTNNVYVLNDQLQYCRLLSLHYVAKLVDVHVNNREVIVSDYMNMKIYAVSLGDGRKLYQLSSSTVSTKRPVCVRRDGKGFIYVLWSNAYPGLGGTYNLSVYNNDMKLLFTKPIYASIRCFTVGRISSKEKLLMISKANGKLYRYGLK